MQMPSQICYKCLILRFSSNSQRHVIVLMQTFHPDSTLLLVHELKTVNNVMEFLYKINNHLHSSNLLPSYNERNRPAKE